MGGIAGSIDARVELGDERLAATGSAMAASLHHRGPDDSGVWVDRTAGISLAHRRLATLDRSPAGRQPMLSSCGRFVLVHDGEIYNHAELRLELAKAGRAFRGESDSEVLVEACTHWGVAATLKRLNGMFAFAAWDRQTRTLYLARDRVGIKPLYWARFGSLFLFGSELKALRAHEGWIPRIDRESLRAYMRTGFVPAPYSIYRGVHKLHAGDFLVCGSRDEPKISSYWDPAKIVAKTQACRFDLSETCAVDRLDVLLRDAVGLQMTGDAPVGALLSGGISSSLVVAMMQAQSSRRVDTFTIGFGEKRFDETARASSVARHLRTDHTELRISPADVVGVLPDLPRWFDEPKSSRSEIPAMLVSALARRRVTVALSGEGGNELFGGCRRYYRIRALARAIRHMPPALRHFTADAVDDVLSRMTALHGVVPVEWRPRLSLNKVGQIAAAVREMRDFNSLYRQTRNAVLAPSAFLAKMGERPLRWEAEPHPGIVSNGMERMGYFDFVTSLVDDILTKADRASMAHGLEVRVPLLDHRVVEYAWSLPPRYKYGGKSERKRLLRHLLYQYVPPGLVDRQQKGFSSPLASWLRRPLKAWADELLDERRMNESGFFDGARVRACWSEHLQGTGDHWRLLWGVLMFEQWHRHWAVAPARNQEAPKLEVARSMTG